MKEEVFGALEVFEGKVLIIMEVVIFALFHVQKVRWHFLRLFFCSAFGLHYLCSALYYINKE